MLPLCQCGCGATTRIAPQTRSSRGWIKGQPIRFRQGHALRGRTGEKCNAWKGGTTADRAYITSYAGHNGKRIYKRAHVLIAEKVLGRPLPQGAVVHHIDHDPRNNRNDNLVICESQSYHMILHRRETRLRAEE